jgi:hypothetical protein
VAPAGKGVGAASVGADVREFDETTETTTLSWSVSGSVAVISKSGIGSRTGSPSGDVTTTTCLSTTLGGVFAVGGATLIPVFSPSFVANVSANEVSKVVAAVASVASFSAYVTSEVMI